MKKVDFLIVGGSASGTTAAEVIRSLSPDASITIVTDEPHEEYSRVLLPQYITHKVARENIFLKKANWYREKLIELIKLTRVTKLNSKEHKVTLENSEEIKYGKLLIAVGGFPLKLTVPGDDLENIHYLRTLEDADKFIEDSKTGKKGLIVGGGLVSLDFAEGMRANGIEDVTILVREPYYWSGKLDEDSSKIIKSVLYKNNVKIEENVEVDHFMGDGKVSKVITKSGKVFDCDVVGIGIGIKSDFSWLSGSGIKIDKAIVTNEYLESSIADVYAAGDCAQFHDVIFEREHIMGNWANATSQGAAVARTMVHSASSGQVGQRTVFESASSYSDSFFEGKYSFLGVCDDKFADEVISRGSFEAGKKTRIFIKTIGGRRPGVAFGPEGVVRIIGATIINNPMEVAPLTTAVKNKVDVSAQKDKLGDVDFDLKSLLS